MAATGRSVRIPPGGVKRPGRGVDFRCRRALLAGLVDLMSDDKTRVLTQEELSRLPGGSGSAPADDGRTRVLSAAEVEGLVSKPAARSASATVAPAASPRPTAAPARDPALPPPEPLFKEGKIVFYCSNGHKITVEAAAAGKRGKCSKAGCGVPVVIPVPPGAVAEAPEAATPIAAPPPAPLPDVPVIAPAEPAVAPGDVPAVPAAGVADGPADGPAEPDSWDFVSGAPPESGGSGPGLDLEPPALAPALREDFDADAGDNPTARLLARLWLERDHGGIVELHLSGGSVLVPEWYEPRWSRGTHGLFASQAPDGTVTLTAVAWEAIQKIIVRKVNGLPDGMF